jgi:hypothetical protein
MRTVEAVAVVAVIAILSVPVPVPEILRGAPVILLS